MPPNPFGSRQDIDIKQRKLFVELCMKSSIQLNTSSIYKIQRAKLSVLIAYLLETSKKQQESSFKYAYLMLSINQVRNILWSPKSSTLLMWPPRGRPFFLASHLPFPTAALYSRYSECTPVSWGVRFSLTSGPSYIHNVGFPWTSFSTSLFPSYSPPNLQASIYTLLFL